MKLNHSEISKITSGRVLESEPMSRRTTFRVGGPCDFYVEVKTTGELKQLLQYIREKKVDYLVVGFGSNILIKDKGFRGIVIRLTGDFFNLDFNLDKNNVIAGGGCALQLLVKKCADNGLGGMEFLVGIPGTIGGAVIMNAGTKDGNIGSIVKSVTIMDEKGGIKKIDKKSLKFSYRSSDIPEKNIVISAEFVLKKKDKSDIIKKLNELLLRRAKTQPIGYFNAGCVFKNPDNDYASRLIDKAGLKGVSVGDAVVSGLHANYINNTGNATASDILKLIKIVQKKVKDKFSKKLGLEIKIIGK
ncbi:MAG: UDP-N-acetylmuramate dehydrogenase [Elusimicrobia bacterium]|nr:UDP-N-acetylmuramate dehydrogenase [Elusimicrobiota bacterium]